MSAVMPPTNSTVLAECTTQRASMQNVMSNMDANAPAFKCASAVPAQLNESLLNDSDVSGYMTDSAQSTPSKELPAYSAAAPARYTHSPYGMDVMGSGSTFVPQLPSRMSAQFTRRQSQQAIAHRDFNYHGATAFPATVQPNARRGKKNNAKNNNKPHTMHVMSSAAPAAYSMSPATPTSPVTATTPSKNMGRVYRNGRPVPLLPNGQPMFPADEE